MMINQFNWENGGIFNCCSTSWSGHWSWINSGNSGWMCNVAWLNSGTINQTQDGFITFGSHFEENWKSWRKGNEIFSCVFFKSLNTSQESVQGSNIHNLVNIFLRNVEMVGVGVVVVDYLALRISGDIHSKLLWTFKRQLSCWNWSGKTKTWLCVELWVFLWNIIRIILFSEGYTVLYFVLEFESLNFFGNGKDEFGATKKGHKFARNKWWIQAVAN